MPPKKHPTVWKAAPHTVAKIAILEGYLQSWFQIFGRRAAGRDLLYIDGFAGPGRYKNHPTGSPVAALRAAINAIASCGTAWTAGDAHFAFIEPVSRINAHLSQHIEPFHGMPRLRIQVLHSSFVEGIATLKQQRLESFGGIFAFIDPFGATGVPFTLVADLLNRPWSEVLINFDVDGVGRIYRAGESAGHERNLNAIFGDDSWKEALGRHVSFQHLCRAILALYLDRLRSLPNIRYVFPFEMRASSGAIDYFLVFASQHPTGLKKMKGAMKKIDQNGAYVFSDAHVGNQVLFRFDRPEDFALKMHRRFAGNAVTYAEINDFALNETPFDSPKLMLRWLDKRELLIVTSSNTNRRRGDFPESTTKWIEFKGEVPDG